MPFEIERTLFSGQYEKIVSVEGYRRILFLPKRAEEKEGQIDPTRAFATLYFVKHRLRM